MSELQVEFIRSTLKLHLSDLSNLHSQIAAKREHNVFLSAISEEISVMSKLSRSLTSKLGNKLANVARDLARSRFGDEAVPRILISSSIDEEIDLQDYDYAHTDTLVLTNVDQDILETEGQKLISFAKTSSGKNRIGTESFAEQYLKGLENLKRHRVREISSLRVDLFVDQFNLGFCELESGGELDTSNVKSQPLKLLKAGLAYGDVDTALHFCLSYANNGEGNPIKGGLVNYLTPQSDSETGDGLLIGSEWWNSILPDEIEHRKFLQIFKEVTNELEILS